MRTLVPLMVLAMIFSIVACAGAQTGEVKTLSDKLTICGYSQVRYDGGDKLPAGAGDPEDFTLRRAFLNVIANPNERCMIVLSLATFDPMPPTNAQHDLMVYNLFMDYKLNDVYSVRFGQVPTYFGLEGWQGSAERVALERAMILQGSGAGNNTSGFYFFGAPDRGIWLKRAGEGSAPDIYLGVCNGQGRNGDYDSNKNYSIDLKWKRDWGMFGVSWFDGEYNDAGPSLTGEQDREAIDAYVKYQTPGWDFQAEYADGEMLGFDRDGWYVQVCKVKEGKTWKPYLKYEQFNSDGPVAPADFEAIHGGIEWQVDDHNELTVQVSDMDLGNDDAVKFGVQWQMSF